MSRNQIIIGSIVLVVILVGGVFLMSKSSGSDAKTETAKSNYKWQKLPDLGRTHVKEGTHVTYNSNPPTSGPHYPIWQKYGILDKPVADELLVHSLEHGYVIMSYNCAKLPKGTSCDTLKQQLTEITKEKRTWKLIVIPRPSLDVPLALTAWTYLDKMEKFDKNRILAFIDDFRDHGPEQTME
jgi:hypothetical protein